MAQKLKGEKEEKPKEEKKEKGPEKPQKKHGKKDGSERLQNIVRFAETNLDGTKTVRTAILNIKGVSFMFGNAVANICDFSDKRVSELSEEEMKTLEDIMMKPWNHNIPPWLYNRRRDPSTNENRHLLVSQLDLTRNMDINEMKKLRSYKGVRHSLGLPVRGQRTRSTFKKSGKVVGVRRKREEPARKK